MRTAQAHPSGWLRPQQLKHVLQSNSRQTDEDSTASVSHMERKVQSAR